MNKTIKIIDLLNKIANGEIPKEIKYNNYFLSWDDVDKDYYCEYYGNLFTYLFSNVQTTVVLDYEIEIIEDNDKTDEEAKPITKESIEALGYACGKFQKCFTNGWTKALENKSLKDNDNLEKINITEDSSGNKFIKTGNYKYTIRAVDEYFANKINGIMDHINKIEEKLDER